MNTLKLVLFTTLFLGLLTACQEDPYAVGESKTEVAASITETEDLSFDQLFLPTESGVVWKEHEAFTQLPALEQRVVTYLIAGKRTLGVLALGETEKKEAFFVLSASSEQDESNFSNYIAFARKEPVQASETESNTGSACGWNSLIACAKQIVSDLEGKELSVRVEEAGDDCIKVSW